MSETWTDIKRRHIEELSEAILSKARQGMTQEQAAEELQMTATALGDWVRSHNLPWTFTKERAIERALFKLRAGASQ